jgi:UDP-N-acetyl-D-glucosamine/UDP-N-acetyl-D-galactosamine dehydrogenase
MTQTVAVVGLGYVGLPLAVEFGRVMPTIGYDLSAQKIANFKRFEDPTGEVNKAQFELAKHLVCTADVSELAKADFLVVAVPTPVDVANRPDFSPLESASRVCGKYMKKGAIVIFESTVYPGATEEICVPILEKESGLVWKKDFFVGYSPERINPGDKVHTLPTIVKVVSGDTPDTLEAVAQLYLRVVTAGVHRAANIKVAEAAKVIENTQRDINIALMNELAMIFDRIGIDTMDVLEAAGTKWNFLPFRPGLVGGHCIGVDPYYLTHKAAMLGYRPQVILSGRGINDAIGPYCGRRTIKEMVAQGFPVRDQPVLVLGLTFKENVPDIRNSKVIDVIREMRTYGCTVYVHDPIADPAEARHEYGVELTAWEDLPKAAAVVLAVAHEEYKNKTFAELAEKLQPKGVISDIKGVLDRNEVAAAGFKLFRL